MKAVNVIHLKD